MTLSIAIPSKGRLKDDTLSAFAKAGLDILPPADRAYQTSVAGRDDIDILFLSASEIARELAAGRVHLGVTGEDLVRETIPRVEEAVAFRSRLGFGRADVVVAVPQAWVDVESMDDLDDVAAGFRQKTGRRLRVATKYWRLTRNFFRDHGVGVYRIVESLGATEGAPAAGSADVIVDITSTGSTIRANRLKILATMLESEACLIHSKRAGTDDATARVLEEVVSRIEERG